MSTERDSLIRMARWGREQGKKNVIADLGPLCEMADEIDRLEADLAKHRTSAEYYAAALGMCEAKLTHAHDELAKANADMEQVIGDVKAGLPRPAVIVRTATAEVHGFELIGDAVSFYNALPKGENSDPTGQRCYIGVPSWHWHPKSS